NYKVYGIDAMNPS
ncbi:hypothetical protein DBR06_SOUSAS1210128, partial [Sousa chinensis]